MSPTLCSGRSRRARCRPRSASPLNLLLDLRDRLGLTYLLVGHNLAIIEFICDRVGVLHQGTLVDTFRAEELFSPERHVVTQSLLGAVLSARADA